ncbi:SphA family protein [Edaphobacter flagellatus]|uniref:SphA family protein n=1 Tax=Edaphobacter flagellatus TaxID=1933044 RepID=UPI0021B18C49|nr:transporter [Edaphobacter flagellatus]
MRVDIIAALKQTSSRSWTRSVKAVLTICTAIMGCISTTPLTAQVQLPSVNLGDTNFEDGFAGPGFLLEEFPDVYSASTLKDSKGITVPGTNTLTAIASTSHVAYVSNKRLFGAWVGAEFLVPIVDVEVKVANGTNATVRGEADPVLGPFALQWAPKQVGRGVFVQRAILDLTVPIGKYSDRRPVNIGNNFVTINPYYAFTYEWNRKFEVSARFHYLWNSTNKNPFVGLGIRAMQPGQAFHTNYATSYEVLKRVRVGFNGYWLQQLTDHHINGENVPNSKERTVGLGPGVQFGGNGLWFRVNSYIETDVRNRTAGTRVTFRISKALPIRGSKP